MTQRDGEAKDGGSTRAVRSGDDPALAATVAPSAIVPTTRRGTEDGNIADTRRDRAPALDDELPVDGRVSSVDLGLAATLASDSGARSGRPLSAEVPHPSVTITSEHPARYERERELGRGGMGRVVVALDRHLGRTVAMKELLGGEGLASELGLSIGTVARFLREARITGQLEHPGIVPVHELGRRADGTLYYTMKRIRGRSLAAVLKEARTLEERLRLLGAFRSVCEAMAYAHSRGVVHRDLKPDNIMVGEFGDTLVVDWGLAKVRGEEEAPLGPTTERVDVLAAADAAQTVSGVAMGTPAYMSPEQARGDLRSIDERADVWGLGAILFEILTGRPPFTGASVFDVLRRVMEERPPKVLELEPNAPPELCAVVDRALLADPTSRYPTGKEVAAEIAAWQDGRQVRAYEYSALERARRFVRRNLAASVAALVVTTALVSASALIYRSYLHEEAARLHAESERDAADSAMRGAEESARRAEVAVAEALLDRSERALDDGDPSGAAVLAAGVLLRDTELTVSSGAPLDTTSRARTAERDVRARSILLEAGERSRYVFERVVGGAHHRSVLSEDGRRIVIPTESDLRVVDLMGTGEEARVALHAQRLLALDGDMLVVEGDAPGVYSLATGTRRFATGHLADAELATRAGTDAAPSDGRLALVEEGVVRVVAREGGAELGRLEAVSDVTSVAWAAGGSLLGLLRGSETAVTIVPWPLGAERTSIPLEAMPFGIDASMDGGRLAAVILDSAVLVIDRIDGPAPSPHAMRFETRGWTTDARWDGTGALALLEDGERIVLVDTETAHAVETLHVVASSGGRIDTAGERIVLFPYALTPSVRGASVFRRSGSLGPDTRTLPTAIRDIVVDGERHRVVLATLEAVYSVDLGPRRLGTPTVVWNVPRDNGIPSRLAILSDGAVAMVTSRGALLVGASDGSVEVALPPDARSFGGVLGLAIQVEDNELFVGQIDGTVRRWSRRAHAPGGLLVGHTGAVTAIALSPDGRTLATASMDQTVRLWNARTGESEHVLSGHAELAADVAFSPDGLRLATADGVGRMRLFDTHDAHLVYHTTVHTRWLNRIVWSEDGAHIATASDDGTVRVVAAADLSATRIFHTRAAPIAVAIEGGRVLYHDGRELVRIDARLDAEPVDPHAALGAAEARAGVTLDGLMLVPRSE